MLNEVIEGDCLDALPTIPAQSVDLILTDLPYGSTACAWDSIIPLEPLWEQYRRVIKPNGAIVLFGSQPFTTILIASQMPLFRYCLVWEKNRPTGFHHAKNKPLKSHEDICVFGPGVAAHRSLSTRRMTYNAPGVSSIGEKVMTDASMLKHLNGARPNQLGRRYEAMTGYTRSVLRFSKDEQHLHPTQKPLALCEWLIRAYSNEGETVLDSCAGSSSTAIAALNTGRNFIMIERDPGYAQISRDRIRSRV